MLAIFDLKDLMVVGCTEVPVLEPAMPRRLSAIFRVKSSMGEILQPPYTLSSSHLIEPQVITQEEFEDFVQCEEITSYHPTQAKSNYELWIDDFGKFNYEDSEAIKIKLREIFAKRYSLSEKELTENNWSAAREHSVVAYAANPRSLKVLIIRAAAEYNIKIENQSTTVESELSFTEKIASQYISIEDFRELYIRLANSVNHSRNTLQKSYFGHTKYIGVNTVWNNLHENKIAEYLFRGMDVLSVTENIHSNFWLVARMLNHCGIQNASENRNNWIQLTYPAEASHFESQSSENNCVIKEITQEGLACVESIGEGFSRKRRIVFQGDKGLIFGIIIKNTTSLSRRICDSRVQVPCKFYVDFGVDDAKACEDLGLRVGHRAINSVHDDDRFRLAGLLPFHDRDNYSNFINAWQL